MRTLAPRQIDTAADWAIAGRELRLSRYLVLAAGHVLLGVYLVDNPVPAAAHALIVAGIAFVGILGGAGAAWAAAMAAYMTGAGVLWRMTEAPVQTQFAKYGIVMLFGAWLIRNRRLYLSPAPLVYLVLLLPSIALVVFVGGRNGTIYKPLSFNLSGPLALTMAVLFFRQATLRREEVLKIIAALALPIFSVMAIAGHATLNASEIKFAASNMITSGGYGPNQVSAALGLGSMALVLLFFLTRPNPFVRLGLLLGASLLGLQCALTFSRGGLIGAGAALLAGVPFLLSDPKRGKGAVVKVLVLIAIITFVMMPLLQDFTGGKFVERIQDTQLTGRDDLMQRDLQLWTSNALMGVGPGLSKLTDVAGTQLALAHTEFTRLISEHGAFGALAILVLLAMGWTSIRSARPGVPRGLAVTFTVWGLLYMFHAAMRLAAPSFTIGLGAGMAGLLLSSSDEEGDDTGGVEPVDGPQGESPAEEPMPGSAGREPVSA